jgi:hypothetical protein
LSPKSDQTQTPDGGEVVMTTVMWLIATSPEVAALPPDFVKQFDELRYIVNRLESEDAFNWRLEIKGREVIHGPKEKSNDFTSRIWS